MSSYKFGLILFIVHDVFSQLFPVLGFFLVDFFWPLALSITFLAAAYQGHCKFVK